MIPPHLRTQAAEHDLGEFVRRYRRRPGVIGTFVAFAPLVGALVLGIRESDPTTTLGILVFLWPPLFLTWCVSTRRRLDGGVYLFTGGFAEVHGRKVRYAVPWARVREVRYKSVEHWLNFIPVAYIAKCMITLDNGGVIELDGSYRSLERLAQDLGAH
ncbi:hypothetical protein CFP71_10955 [Amycolatopsis thailandensis]|uniref:DUF304 domain-containing protein n=1 Tax=Amycolatopsis thailandensis TaxID=589330 RepID=A0A229SD99_9PSEU|nr:hypothetical protein [Amycolatopsis thailandensis]OXM56830.1 hypothetical protein CFP71_10955 [Amycolatopsis thailandensis]